MGLQFDLSRAIREVMSQRAGTDGTTRALLTYLMDLLYYGDFRIVEQAAAFSDDHHTNLVGMRGSGNGGLLLTSAVTESPPTHRAEWTETEEDPWNPTERDGLLFGRGAVSGKVDLVCKILAAGSVEAEALVRPITIAGLFGRDARVGGAMFLLDSGLCQPDWALVGEATNLELVSGHRGYLVLRVGLRLAGTTPAAVKAVRVFRVEAHGQPAHSALPSVGRNAVELALGRVAQLRKAGHTFTVHDVETADWMGCVPTECSFYLATSEPTWIPSGPDLTVEEVSRHVELGPSVGAAVLQWNEFHARLHELFRWTAPDPDPDFVPSGPLHCVLDATVDEGGSELVVRLDYRTLPGQKSEALVHDIEALAQRTAPDGSITVEIERNLMPMHSATETPLTRHAKAALSEVGVPPVVATFPGTTEGWIFAAAGIDTLAFGPGRYDACFRANEHTVLDHIEKATAFYERVIRKLCT